MAAPAAPDPQAELERAADAIWDAEFLLTVVGPLFDDGRPSPFNSDFCDPGLVSKPNKFMGFWGAFYNDAVDRNPHEGFTILAQWRDRLFSGEDLRKKGKKKDEEVSEFDRMPRSQIYTGYIGNMFQKAGIPTDEVYEANGNVTYWQCSRVPPCSQQTWTIDRGFRFVIDDTNKEAAPIKYLTDKQLNLPKTTVREHLVDSEEEELNQLKALKYEAVFGKDALGKRIQRRRERPRVIRLGAFQVGKERFADLFCGFSLDGTHPTSFTFFSAPEDPQALRKLVADPQMIQRRLIIQGMLHGTTISSSPIGSTSGKAVESLSPSVDVGSQPEGGTVDVQQPDPTLSEPQHVPPSASTATEETSKPQQQKKPLGGSKTTEYLVVPPVASSAQLQLHKQRASHLLAHVLVLDEQSANDRIGRFFYTEPERWLRERDQFYQSLGKPYVADNHVLATKRSKYMSFNISVVITTTQTSPSSGGAASDPPTSNVLDASLRRKLFSLDEALVRQGERELEQEYLSTWRNQGERGWYYFSHVAAKQTIQEPIFGKFADVIHIPFPCTWSPPPIPGIPASSSVLPPLPGSVTFEGLPTHYTLPETGVISVVCEAVVNLDQIPLAEGEKPRPPRDPNQQPSPYSYTQNVFQIVGQFTRQNLSKSAEFQGKDTVELALETKHNHVFKVGLPKSGKDSDQILYMKLEVPCEEADPVKPDWHLSHAVQRNPIFAESNVASPSTTAAVAVGTASGPSGAVRAAVFSASSSPQASAAPPKPKKPIPFPNHQLCQGCHDVARPYVLMAKPGLKDDGFCGSVLAARTKQYKAWEKLMMDAMKADSSKSLVILEVGCDRKMDVARAYSEKTFKVLKQSRCTFVRISPYDLETKAKGKSEGAAANNIVVQAPVIASLGAIDRLLNEKRRKLGR